MSDPKEPPRGSFYLRRDIIGSGTRPRLRVKLVKEELPSASAATLGIHNLVFEGDGPVKIVTSRALLNSFLHAESFSELWEDGGFLVGRAYADTERGDDAYIVSIAAAPRAQATIASVLTLTYTGDSFTEVKRLLRDEFYGERLLGWYHTHLFAADDEMGLSEPDVRLHFTTFRQPWQVAGLINLPPQGRPTLRFYAAQDNTMALCSVYCPDADWP